MSLAHVVLQLSVPSILTSLWPSTQLPFCMGYVSSQSLSVARALT